MVSWRSKASCVLPREHPGFQSVSAQCKDLMYTGNIMESLLRLRTVIRRRFKLEELPPWWQRRHANHKAFQLAMGVNLAVVAIVLPYFWNRTVNGKAEARREARSAKRDSLVEDSERIAVQMIVNERRRARGLPPYPYEAVTMSPEQEAFFATVEAQRRRRIANKDSGDTTATVSSALR